ncbi:glycosyltransferase [Cohnella sp. REN36]|uniref:MGDG synthase family glycosyltransferase n=1 Tax=Cohnella sp. REN36 TaxID=2887347 RepID=UPI001D1411CE|nr:glycosyltransferase [Cohnella sp. REN36]MCC3371499.1 UDP-N-acetylglucosamine 2-epimerase [Cohnella sp. REN36]
MTSETRIQIVYSSFGDGHLQAALAVKQSFAEMGIDRVDLIDLFAEAHPRLNAASRYFYLKSAVHAPRLYGLLYRLTNRKPHGVFGRLFHSFGHRRLLESWREERPDLIIHTFPQLAADELRRRVPHHIPTFTILTDFTLHSRWIHPRTTGYFVATEALKRELANAGVPEHRISVTGIPVRDPFSQPMNRYALCRAYGLDPARRHVLIMAGAYGVQTSVRAMMETALRDTECDLIVVCGKNRRLQQDVDAVYLVEDRVHTLGYADKVHELMAIADCMLTKAGGMTLSEALAMSLPTIVYRPLPGQESGNAEALAKEGALGIATTLDELSRELQMALDPAHAERMMAAMADVYRARSSERIALEALRFDGTANASAPAVFAAERKAVGAHV